MGRINSRRKGHSYEREIVNALKEHFPMAERTQEGDKLDRDGMDLKNTGPFAIQCKRGRKYSPARVLEEIKTTLPYRMVITKADRKESVVQMYFHEFMDLLSKCEIEIEDKK